MSKLTEAEKARKRTRKNWKRYIKARYKQIMYLAELNIENAAEYNCTLRFKEDCNERFTLWLVEKKLESKGYKCELKKGIFLYSKSGWYDELHISW